MEAKVQEVKVEVRVEVKRKEAKVEVKVEVKVEQVKVNQVELQLTVKTFMAS